jgi:hypothetical protein
LTIWALNVRYYFVNRSGHIHIEKEFAMKKLIIVAAVAVFAFAVLAFAAQKDASCCAAKSASCQMAKADGSCCAMAAAECKGDSAKCGQCPDKGKCDKKECPKKDGECKKDCPKKDAPPKK